MDAYEPVTLILIVVAGVMLVVASIAVLWAFMGIFTRSSDRDPAHSLLGPVRISEALEPELRELYVATRTIREDTHATKKLGAEIRRYLIELQALRITNGHALDPHDEVYGALNLLLASSSDVSARQAAFNDVWHARAELGQEHEAFSQTSKCARLTEREKFEI